MGFQFRGSFSFTLSEKLKALKACLKIWNREVFGDVTIRKDSALKHMVFWDSIEGDKVLSVEKQIFHSLLSETYEWRPRCNRLQVGVLEGEKKAFGALSDLNGDKAPGPDSEDLKDFRLISLVGSLYMLLAKIVSKSQNAFVEGTQILDASLIANEAIDSMQKSRGGGILYKLDIEKLSGRGGAGVEVTHLLFVDDSLVFCEPSIDQVSYLSWFLMWFEAMSGLKVNLDKSEIIAVGRAENVEELALEFGCKVSKLPYSYLGLHLGARFNEMAVWDEVEERLRKRLSFWTKQYISKGG
ncbi:hypothetical protein AAG906_026074 [Vitis piasezkii]